MDIKELTAKAKAAGSPEELLKIAEEEKCPLTEKEAEKLFNDLHSKRAVSDDELGSVSGGAYRDEGYKAVEPYTKCFTGCYEDNFKKLWEEPAVFPRTDFSKVTRTDHWLCRCVYLESGYGLGEVCGSCCWLGFSEGMGYCDKSKS